MELGDLLLVSTMTLATCGPGGEPHAAPVYFAAASEPGLQLFFFSDPRSQHSQDVMHNPRAAAALYPECRDWREIRGLQMRGIVSRVDAGAGWEQAWQVYQAKFPFVSELKPVVAQNTLYTFKPNWVRLVDNRKGFGFKQEWTFSPKE